MEEFHARTLFLPGHIGLAAQGIEWDTDNANAEASLNTFTAQVAVLDPLAYTMQAYVFNTLVFNAQRDRITQVIVGELSMDEAIERIQEDIDAGLAAQ
jgi:alpha-1,4-digalacturonate transport system substrate-binding protein